MESIAIEVLFILFLILVNGALALSEIAVISARKARIQQWAEAGHSKARLALEISSAPGIEKMPDVVDADDVLHVDVSGLRVHLDLDEMRLAAHDI